MWPVFSLVQTLLQRGVVKSVQRGGVSLDNADNVDVIINSVNLNKAIVLVNAKNPTTMISVTGFLVNSTTLRFSQARDILGTSVRWEVIEFY